MPSSTLTSVSPEMHHQTTALGVHSSVDRLNTCFSTDGDCKPKHRELRITSSKMHRCATTSLMCRFGRAERRMRVKSPRAFLPHASPAFRNAYGSSPAPVTGPLSPAPSPLSHIPHQHRVAARAHSHPDPRSRILRLAWRPSSGPSAGAP